MMPCIQYNENILVVKITHPGWIKIKQGKIMIRSRVLHILPFVGCCHGLKINDHGHGASRCSHFSPPEQQPGPDHHHSALLSINSLRECLLERILMMLFEGIALICMFLQ